MRDLRMLAVGLAAWLGALAGSWDPPPTAAALAAVGALTFGTGIALRRPRLRRALLAWALVAVAVGASTHLRDLDVRAGPVAGLAERHAAVQLRLTVASDPRRSQGRYGDRVWFRASVRRLRHDGREVAVHTPVLVFGDTTWQDTPLGSTVDLRARLAPADGAEVAAVLRPLSGPTRTEPPSRWWRAAATVRAGIREAVSGRPLPERALVPALVDGDDQGLTDRTRQEFETTGLTHLLAVSGTNLTLVVGFLLVVGRWCGIRGRGLYLLGAAGIVGFVLLARTEPSVVRAAAMGAVALVGMSAAGRDPGLRCLGVAVLLLLLWDPWLARTVGFALSVLATAGILLLAPGWSRAMARWMPLRVAQAVAVPLAAQLAVTPVVAAVSGRVSLVAVGTNLIAAPLVAPATVLGLLGGLLAVVSPALGHLPGWGAAWCAAGIIAVAHHGAGVALPAISWGTTGPALAALTLLCGALVFGLGPLLARRTTGIAAGCLVLVVVLIPLPSPGWPTTGWVFVVCDVGQGDGLVLNAGAGTAVVVDAGPDPRLIDHCLDELGVDRVALLVLSHYHADHVDGLPGVLAGRDLGRVLVSPLPEPAGRARAVARALADGDDEGRIEVPAYGDVGRVGQVRYQVLGPVPGSATVEPNDASLVLLAEVRGVRILLPGDVEPPAQERLLAAYPDLRVDVLKVPHHGSRYQDPEFLAALDPAVAVASAGQDNDYGHPAPTTLSTLRDEGARVFTTNRDGAVAVAVRDERLRVTTED